MRLLLGLALLGGVVRRGTLLVAVHGDSMRPALRDGDRVLVLRVGPLVRWWPGVPIVAGRMPAGVGASSGGGPAWLFVKRLVGRPGGIARVSRTALHPDAAVELLGGRWEGEEATWAVPPGHCFVKGDGGTSADSVTWGAIPLRDVVGVVVGRLPA